MLRKGPASCNYGASATPALSPIIRLRFEVRFSVPLEGPTATTRQRDPRIVSTGLDPRELLPRDRKHGSIETTILLTFHQDRRADENRPVSSTTASVGVLRKIYSLYTGKGTARVVAGRMVSGDGSS
ncbi:hypothetical protein HZH68_015150 [Vespula germanica]|uniref:Uncharacterized protein n=1 Tax=Vespula germanica TaxID=30212 RepID=A0A834J7C5_VESGE|nr:hypothetical protein HZH68_015150 [Vespula germanica]